MTRKPRANPLSVIRCGNADDAHLAYMCMFRYAFGRMTYMPGVVIGIIMRNEKYLTDRTLNQLDRELSEEAYWYERVYKDKADKSSTNYGMECDRQAWLRFHSWVREQIKRNGEMK